MKQSYFMPADILLPDFAKVSGEKWAIVACDQFTGEPEYWEAADRFVGAAPSVLRMILPEVYLSESGTRVPAIARDMETYCRDVLLSHPDSMIYLERTQSDGKIRRGLVGMVDLETYDFSRASVSLIRATEGTVLERIPPRCAVRRGAALETPHIMLLIDDPEATVIESLAKRAGDFSPAYDFDLMQGGGHVTGKWVPQALFEEVNGALGALITPEAMQKKYGSGALAPLLFAVGDGNHSLATAKTCYEEIKAQIGEKALSHPARYALCEVVNLHDPSLEFEPIYRVVYGVDAERLLADFSAYVQGLGGTAAAQTFTAVVGTEQKEIVAKTPRFQLPVATLQAFLDEWLSMHPGASVDYIHGEDTLCRLAAREGAVGFLFCGMKKEQLFGSVMRDGPLPRKTFSMGHARDKRYCLDCRKIR